MTTLVHAYPDGGSTTVHFQNDRDRAGYETALERYSANARSFDRWYVCGGSSDAGCGRWFRIDYRDPYAGETLQRHVHGPVQMELFAAGGEQ